MRLKPEEKEVIVRAVRLVDPQAEVFLFGSRLEDLGKGGDIDILIHSRIITLDGKLKIKKEIFSHLEEQKIDIVISPDLEDPFARLIMEEGALKLS